MVTQAKPSMKKQYEVLFELVKSELTDCRMWLEGPLARIDPDGAYPRAAMNYVCGYTKKFDVAVYYGNKNIARVTLDTLDAFRDDFSDQAIRRLDELRDQLNRLP